MSLLSACRLCPRNCGVDREQGKRGFCGELDSVRIALATLHRGEEPPICGSGGSGAVFFSGCTLRCSFCQNCGISSGEVGSEVSRDELAAIYLELESRGAGNLNLVTGTHFLPIVVQSVDLARKRGLRLPVVWNSSGYENGTGLDLIESVTDVYLPDLKTLDSGLARGLFRAPEYPSAAASAILRMAAAGSPEYDEGGMLIKGTIVRHLVLPGMLENTRRILEWYAENLSERALLSVMFQYLPIRDAAEPGAAGTGRATRMPTSGTGVPAGAPARTIEDVEYYQVIGMLEDLGIDDGFVQEPEPDSPWFPDFQRENPFPDEYSTVVWHWKHGFVQK